MTKFKKIFSAVLCLILLFSKAHSQNIRDHIFNDVILIDNKDIAKIGEDYLIDIPVATSNKVLIFYVSAQIPVNLLIHSPGFYPALSEFIVICPDEAYYKSVAAIKNVNCAEPIPTNKFYQVKRGWNNHITVDSLTIQSNNQPRLNFKNTRETPLDSVVMYYSVEYGSSCCPRDILWENKITLTEFIQSFEKLQGLAIGNTYKKVLGKEGEHIVFFPLEKLSTAQKLAFIAGVRDWRIVNKELKDMVIVPQVFTSFYYSRQGLIEYPVD